MNFLEQLAAEYYGHLGYFIRTNIRFGKLPRGGYAHEIDVLAYKPGSGELIHVETSGDAASLGRRTDKFNKKFLLTDSEYHDILQADYKSIERVVIAGWSVNPIARPALDKPVKVILIPEFFDMIIKRIHESDFSTSAISENFPILRTIQMIDKYQDLSQKNQKK